MRWDWNGGANMIKKWRKLYPIIICSILFLVLAFSVFGFLDKKENNQSRYEDSMDINSIVDDTPVTTTEYGEYIENKLSDAISEIIPANEIHVKLDVTDDFHVQTANINVGNYILSDS